MPPPGLVWRVLTELNAYYDDIEDPTDRPTLISEVPAGVLVPVEVNDDGRPDWLIAWPEEMAFCGTGGCARTLYVSHEGGFYRALDRQALDLKIEKVDGEVRVEAWVHHLNCADERPDCRYAWAWDEASHRLAPRIASDGVARFGGTGTTVIDDAYRTPAQAQDTWPQTLRNQWEASGLVCLTDYNEGYETRSLDIATVPDLNGDGRLDWVAIPPTTCDGQSPEHAFSVWTTTEGQGEQDEVILAYAGGAETSFLTDLSAPTPHLEVSQPCSGDAECPSVPLRWNAARGRLEE